jgi:hypothetical protein
MQLPGDANLPFDEFRRDPDLERLRLPEVSGAIVNRTRGIALPDADFADCQLFDI